MKALLYSIIIAVSFLVPVQKLDVENLLPIEAVALYYEDGRLMLETDSGHKGAGDTLEEALKDLKERTPAQVYLDTAKYLMVAPEATGQIEGMKAHLGGRTEVTIWDVREKVKVAMQYLEAHGKTVQLKHIS